MQIQVYNGAGTTTGFNPATPCGNIRRVVTSSSTAPHIALLEYLTIGLYDVVITSEYGYSTYQGLFAVHADPAKFAASNIATTNYWTTPSSSYYGTFTCTPETNSVPFLSYSFNVSTTGNYDLFYWSYNGTDTISYLYGALYNSTPSFVTTPSTNMSNPSDPCANDANKFVASIYNTASESYSRISQTSYVAGAMWNYALTAGVTYTVVISGYYSYDRGFLGFWYRPSTGGNFGTTGDYLYPDYGSLTCASRNTVGSIWGSARMEIASYTITAAGGYVDSYNWNYVSDTVLVLYRGVNTGTVTPTSVPPTPCPLTGSTWVTSNDGDVVADYNAVSGSQNYTAVYTAYSSGASATQYVYSLFFYSGTQLGGVGPTTSTGGASSSSDAFTLCASVFLVICALLF
jgi:hypothetical protein